MPLSRWKSGAGKRGRLRRITCPLESCRLVWRESPGKARGLSHHVDTAWGTISLGTVSPFARCFELGGVHREEQKMKTMLPLLCIAALAGCDSNTSTLGLNGSITGALKPGMTEQQVAEVSNNRVPDRVVMTTCGTETPKPFACKVFVYEGAGQYDPKLSVVLEDVGGQWKVSQWL